MEIIIDNAVPDDIPEIAAIEAESFSDPWRSELFMSELSRDMGIFLTAKKDREIVGYIIGTEDGCSAFIDNIATKKSARREGVGTALMAYFLLGLPKTVESVSLEVRESNIPAQGLYSKFGFKEAGIRKDLYASPRENGIVMIMDLERKKGSETIEKMDDFFAARVDGYDEHMLTEVEGCREAYAEMAKLVPSDTKSLLDLGCGTGLELEGIFERLPHISVTGIDLTKEMLDRLSAKYPDKNITLINGDYFKTDFGQNCFDTAISFETMHHFSHEMKIGLYKKIYQALREDGVYIECDYMVETQEEEDHWYAENARMRGEMGIPENEFYHYDTPCTIENQIKFFLAAGFAKAEKVFQMEGTVIIIAYKNKGDQ
ncbi:MAG: ribosomal protein S18-alanine N-acetyltransferase [Oscillospiraceae bacterium]|nr:ribosomal protein S18-alanine N-acetyltransferase [Oscillospiraceae bacterium]